MMQRVAPALWELIYALLMNISGDSVDVTMDVEEFDLWNAVEGKSTTADSSPTRHTLAVIVSCLMPTYIAGRS